MQVDTAATLLLMVMLLMDRVGSSAVVLHIINIHLHIIICDKQPNWD